MFYIYVLKSQVNGDIYIGYSTDLKTRFNAHNAGSVKSTKGYKPWILAYYEAYRNKKDATKREKELKLHAAKKFLVEHLKESLKTNLA
jgi:putative endonuclease